ncbi:glycylpeptide N-tetradecanoyltransferase 1 isoform X2 [Coregonus clupeaformis]|uniref:glycylpeptide N-tetradecanoyltransferase 1 isoform X2 n=1 Tax=Coregonus clupeaformis TaxID=59861 RepID=UPI001E1C982F|nr:glycylpeptide N-tetradecanoyltransferase 1 isoform X2 [Coregonus clupeaformis]
MTDSNLSDKNLGEENGGGLKKKNKQKKSKEDAWRLDGPKDPFAMLDALPEEKQQEIQRALHLFSLGKGLPRTLEEASRRPYPFWDTQPVPKLGDDNATTHGPIEVDKASVREEPYSLPQGFSWAPLDLGDPAMLRELCALLNENYMEEDDNTSRFDFSPEYLLWPRTSLLRGLFSKFISLALCPPGWLPQWHFGVRVNTNQKLVGFIAAVPINIRIYDTEKRMVQVHFLCVHKKLRSKRMTPVLIREVTRRVNLQRVYQAVYTASGVLPKPVATCRYWHRSLNTRKLIEVNFPISSLRGNMTVQRALKLNRLLEAPKTAGLRPMTRGDVKGVHMLLQGYLKKYHLTPVLSQEEVEHWLLPRENVIDTYVVESSGGVLTDFVSFYTMASRVLNHPVHKGMKAAHSLYCVSSSTPLPDLMEDTLFLAKAKGFDVFTVLDVMENTSFLEKLKFGIGDKSLHYYLYNWRCPTIGLKMVGLVLL